MLSPVRCLSYIYICTPPFLVRGAVLGNHGRRSKGRQVVRQHQQAGVRREGGKAVRCCSRWWRPCLWWRGRRAHGAAHSRAGPHDALLRPVRSHVRHATRCSPDGFSDAAAAQPRRAADVDAGDDAGTAWRQPGAADACTAIPSPVRSRRSSTHVHAGALQLPALHASPVSRSHGHSVRGGAARKAANPRRHTPLRSR